MDCVSIIIPTYNRRDMVIEAVESVLSQDYPEKEVIVVDDGSTDDTSERLFQHFDRRITLLRQENRGVSAARNCGILASAGTFLAFLDSDDSWLPGKLSAQMKWMEAHPEFAACQTEEVWIRDGVRVNPCRHHRKHSGWIFEKLLPLCLVSPSAVLVRRDVFEEVGLFDESFPACEDYDLWIRIGARHPIGLIETPLTVKRGGHADQLSRTVWGLDRYRIASLQKALNGNFLDLGQKELVREELRKKCGIYIQGCLKRGKADEAKEYRDLMDSFLTPTPTDERTPRSARRKS